MSCEDQVPISQKCLFNKAQQGLPRELKQSENLQIILLSNLILPADRAVPQPLPCPDQHRALLQPRAGHLRQDFSSIICPADNFQHYLPCRSHPCVCAGQTSGHLWICRAAFGTRAARLPWAKVWVNQTLALSGHQFFAKQESINFSMQAPPWKINKEGFMRKPLGIQSSLLYPSPKSHSKVQGVMSLRQEHGEIQELAHSEEKEGSHQPWVNPGAILDAEWPHQDKNDALIWKNHSLGHNYINEKVCFFFTPFLAQQTVGNKML